MVILGNTKNVFWEALLLTIVVFFFGLLLGVAYEANRADEMNEYYVNSEISLMDVVILNDLVDLENYSCEILINSSIDFADRIYEEASLLEKYDKSGKITTSIKLAHRKYDLLRTLLWIDVIKIQKQCVGDFSYIVYLYEYDTDDLTKKATQRVWSKILFELKQSKKDEIILIPIAVNSNLISLDSMLNEFEISEFPALIIDNEFVINTLSSVGDLNKYLD